MTRRRLAFVVTLVLTLFSVTRLRGEELTRATIAAFDRYIQLTEKQAASSPGFLWTDSLPDPRRGDRLAALRKGEYVIEQRSTQETGRDIDIPDGMVHHWVGMVFAQGATLDEAVALLQDYDRHAQIYQPNVARSTLRTRNGNRFDFFLRFRMKKVITVVVNSEHRAQFTRDGPNRASSRIYSTRIAEVESPDETGERELPVGRDGGYLWRLNSYWKFLEQDGGVYLQCESVSLTRSIPWWGYVARPFVTAIPRETLTFTLETTRQALASRNGQQSAAPRF